MSVSYLSLLKSSPEPVESLSGLVPYLHSAVTFYGVVTAFKPPILTKSGDWAISVTVSDPSLAVGMRGFMIMSFSNKEEGMMKVEVGGIVKCRVQVPSI